MRPDPAAPVSLVVFARTPVAGHVKTRLCAGPGALSPADAAALHGAFVRDVCRAGAESGIGRRRLYAAGADAGPLLGAACAEAGFELREQGEGDLGQRMD